MGLQVAVTAFFRTDKDGFGCLLPTVASRLAVHNLHVLPACLPVGGAAHRPYLGDYDKQIPVCLLLGGGRNNPRIYSIFEA
jgi:hypothetical protein